MIQSGNFDIRPIQCMLWVEEHEKSESLSVDGVGVYNIVDFTPPIQDYSENRQKMEEYAQDQFFIMLKEGTPKLQEYLSKLNGLQGGKDATDAINDWYKNVYTK